MDLTLSSAKIPGENDFPSILRGDYSACISAHYSPLLTADSRRTASANNVGSSVSRPQGQTDTVHAHRPITSRREETRETETASGGDFNVVHRSDTSDDQVMPMEYTDLISFALMTSSPSNNPESPDDQSAAHTTVCDSITEVTASLSSGQDNEIDWDES